MADGTYDVGFRAIAQAFFLGTFTPDPARIKLVLLNTTYTFSNAHVWSDLSSHEISGTGYVNGWGGSGRKAISALTPAVSLDTANNRVLLDFTDPVWASLSAGDVGSAALIHEGAADDTTTLPLVFYDPANVTTAGGNLTLQVNATGALAM